MSKNFWGDLVLYETNTKFATWIGWFTGSVYNHCAIRVSEDMAESPDLIEWVQKNDFLRHNLKEPEDYVMRYKILRHKEITDKKRESMMDFYQKVGKEYDMAKIIKLAKMRLPIVGREQDLTDITTDPNGAVYYFSNMIVNKFKGKEKSLDNINPIIEKHLRMHECGEIYGLLLNLVELNHGIEGVHYSQVMPHQFENSKHDIVDIVDISEINDRKHRWWARHNMLGKFSGIRSASYKTGIKTTKTLSSFFNHKP